VLERVRVQPFTFCGTSRILLYVHTTLRGDKMPELHLNVPDEVVKTAKPRAKAAGKSLSSYLEDLVVNQVASEWPEGFFEEVVGGWRGEPLDRPKQGRSERRDRL
jgi:hypothetical protein